MIQIVTPNPNIPCQPGWCLQYVRQTFGAPAVEPTATAGWANAKYRHEDWNFPDGCWVPVWFSLKNEPAGHVALLAPDGSVYSTSDDSRIPHHHPNMQDLISYYWRNPLTYLGWSEDISGVRVVQDISLQSQSENITPVSATQPKEWDDMASIDDFKQAIRDVTKEPYGIVDSIAYRQINGFNGPVSLEARILGTDQAVNDIRALLAGQNAQIAGLVGALAAVSKGEPFDQEKLLAGVKDAAETGVKDAIESITVTVKADK